MIIMPREQQKRVGQDEKSKNYSARALKGPTLARWLKADGIKNNLNQETFFYCAPDKEFNWVEKEGVE